MGRIKDSWVGIGGLVRVGLEKEQDEDWALNFNATIDAMNTTIEEARLLDPPIEYEEAHKLYLKAIDKLSSTPEKCQK